MTEEEWLDCIDPVRVLLFARGRGSERKFRLLACAWARSAWRLTNEARRRAIEAAELVADGMAGPETLKQHRPARMGVAAGTGWTAAREACQAVCYWSVPENVWPKPPLQPEQALTMCRLARCVLAPFHVAPVGPIWRTADVMDVALGAYDDRTLPAGTFGPVRLSILADALEDAGCTAADILTHLRSPAPHVRGCWAVDLALGKN